VSKNVSDSHLLLYNVHLFSLLSIAILQTQHPIHRPQPCFWPKAINPALTTTRTSQRAAPILPRRLRPAKPNPARDRSAAAGRFARRSRAPSGSGTFFANRPAPHALATQTPRNVPDLFDSRSEGRGSTRQAGQGNVTNARVEARQSAEL